ncbi:hypothetical protein BLNAU_15179 [Blattamonas nauphoetae]|uniref:Uncharacterized protein n=1 Tax=Blattamonas nauphoetae TaxID=2049346 RepID=A0ABQ9XD53_9EUKA|nr:hypothetical protein BLNAU_15179 [Blattamonas nauphoetae]
MQTTEEENVLRTGALRGGGVFTWAASTERIFSKSASLHQLFHAEMRHNQNKRKEMVTVLPLDTTELVSGEERQLLINFKLSKTSSPTSDGTGFVPAMDRQKLNEVKEFGVILVTYRYCNSLDTDAVFIPITTRLWWGQISDFQLCTSVGVGSHSATSMTERGYSLQKLVRTVWKEGGVVKVSSGLGEGKREVLVDEGSEPQSASDVSSSYSGGVEEKGGVWKGRRRERRTTEGFLGIE